MIGEGCTGKTGYLTEKQATRAARNLNRKDHKARINPYKCNNCSKFHIGNTLRDKKVKYERKKLTKNDINLAS